MGEFRAQCIATGPLIRLEQDHTDVNLFIGDVLVAYIGEKGVLELMRLDSTDSIVLESYGVRLAGAFIEVD